MTQSSEYRQSSSEYRQHNNNEYQRSKDTKKDDLVIPAAIGVSGVCDFCNKKCDVCCYIEDIDDIDCICIQCFCHDKTFYNNISNIKSINYVKS